MTLVVPEGQSLSSVKLQNTDTRSDSAAGKAIDVLAKYTDLYPGTVREVTTNAYNALRQKPIIKTDSTLV